jgi:hypothetical protein
MWWGAHLARSPLIDNAVTLGSRLLIDVNAPAELLLSTEFSRPNNSLERTQPQREFMYDLAVLRRSARSR